MIHKRIEKRIVLAVTGASGSIYAQRMFHHLGQLAQHVPMRVGVVFSKNAPDVWRHELQTEPPTLAAPFTVYSRDDYFAPFASGSAQYTDMCIVPCSMGTLGRIAHGISDDLTTRAADVILKERRRLICMLRDTPYNQIHINNMNIVSQAGGILLPASPSFYSRPATLEELADTVVLRALDLMGLNPKAYRWGEES